MDRDGGGAMDVACHSRGRDEASQVQRQGAGGAAYKRIVVAAARWTQLQAWNKKPWDGIV